MELLQPEKIVYRYCGNFDILACNGYEYRMSKNSCGLVYDKIPYKVVVTDIIPIGNIQTRSLQEFISCIS